MDVVSDFIGFVNRDIPCRSSDSLSSSAIGHAAEQCFASTDVPSIVIVVSVPLFLKSDPELEGPLMFVDSMNPKLTRSIGY